MEFGAISLSSSLEELRVSRAAERTKPTGAALSIAKRVARDVRLLLALGDEAVLASVRELVSPGAERSLDEPFEPGEGPSEALARAFEDDVLTGRLVVERRLIDALRERENELPFELPPPSRVEKESNTHSFEVRFVDEVGRAISSIDTEIDADAKETVATNAAGLALLENVKSSSATVSVLDVDALSKALDPRWQEFRQGAPPAESNSREVVFEGQELGPFPLKAEVPNRVVIKPPLGKLFVELFDKTGRVRHALRDFEVSGPQSFSGTTDENGRFLIEKVFPGDYSLSLAFRVFEGDPDEVSEELESQLVVLPADAAKPDVRMLGVVPRSVLARLHMAFNTNKTFLLPKALPSLRVLRKLYQDNLPCKLLVVGHADSKGAAATNDKLSLDRAKATIAFLKDDVDAWLAFYKDDNANRRWGKVEDHLMLIALPDYRKKPLNEDELKFFQRTRALSVTGKPDTNTRRALIQEYMSLDGTSLQDFVGEVDAIAHGCGENFPLDDRGEGLDQSPSDNKRDHLDRRVELFFFDTEFGITPPPPGENSKPGSTEYLKWRDRAAEIHDLDTEAVGARLQLVEIEDVLFDTNSAVPLPEPYGADGKVIKDGPGALHDVAAALRFSFCYPGKLTVVAGHTDTTGSPAVNDPLSDKRGLTVLALLVGDRDAFRLTADTQHVSSDLTRCLDWADRRFLFGCAPSRFGGSIKRATEAFQQAYNESDRGGNAAAGPLTVDGDFGKETWGAVFDLCEQELCEILRGDRELLTSYRETLRFVDDVKRSIGFGERFPVDELGRDNIRSQANRRAEILFFDEKDKPDLDAPLDLSDIYLPGTFVHEPQPVDPSKIEIAPVKVARLPTRFSNGRTFPKPSALPLLTQLAKLASEGHSRLVIVGHTDRSLKDDTNAALALARADAVAALLRKDKDFFLQRFQQPDPLKAWSWEEVQWMMSAIKFGEERFYVGNMDDYPSDLTRRALGSFQLHSDSLVVDYGCDADTLSLIIDRYFELLEAEPVPAEMIQTVSCGSWHPRRKFQPDAALENSDPELSSENRRVEVFVFDEPVVPAPATIVPSTRIESPTYVRWCRVTKSELSAGPTPFPLRLFDAALVPIGGTSVSLAKHVPETGDVGATTSLTTTPFGSADFVGEPGSYRLSFSAQGRQYAFAVSVQPDDIGGFAAIISHALAST